MRKLLRILWILLSTASLMAGGEIAPTLFTVAEEIPSKINQTNKVYIEEDVFLMWQDQAYMDAEVGAYKHEHSVAKAGTWNHAMNYCRNLNYASYRDWRLPTADELTHVHRKLGQVFTYYIGDEFWSSTPSTDVRHYVVYPADAYQYKRYKEETNYIRCVRSLTKEERAAISKPWNLGTLFEEKISKPIKEFLFPQ